MTAMMAVADNEPSATGVKSSLRPIFSQVCNTCKGLVIDYGECGGGGGWMGVTT